MKKITILLILLTQGVFAQTFTCGTIPEIIEQPQYNRFHSSADEIKYVFNIFFTLSMTTTAQTLRASHLAKMK